MQNKIETRSSNLWLARKCGMANSGNMDTTSDPAQIGKAVHAMVAHHLQSGQSIEQAALSSGIEPEQYGQCVDLFNSWIEMCDFDIDDLKETIKINVEYETEKSLGFTYASWKNTGHADLVACQTVYDWKTGQVVQSTLDQMMSYAYSMKNINIPVKTRVFWIRSGIIVDKEYTRNELMDWAEQCYTDLRNVQGKYIRGKHCKYCPNRLQCKAWREVVKANLDLVSQSTDDKALTQNTIQGLDKLNRLIKILEDAKKELTQHLKTELAVSPTVVGDQLYYLGEKKSSKTVWNTPSAWKIVRKYIPEEELIDGNCIEIKKGKLIKAVRLHQKQLNAGLTKETRIKLQDAENRVMNELEQSGAMMSDTYPVIKSKKVEEKGIEQ